jgi:hypothetical protein
MVEVWIERALLGGDIPLSAFVWLVSAAVTAYAISKVAEAIRADEEAEEQKPIRNIRALR